MERWCGATYELNQLISLLNERTSFVVVYAECLNPIHLLFIVVANINLILNGCDNGCEQKLILLHRNESSCKGRSGFEDKIRLSNVLFTIYHNSKKNQSVTYSPTGRKEWLSK
jgi:hypothetical protein